MNAALLAGQILGVADATVREAVKADREARKQQVLAEGDPRA